MKKVCVVGHFGLGKNLLNGQTIKTRIITDELCSALGSSQVDTVDTHGGANAMPGTLMKIFKALGACRNVVIFPAHNGLRIIAPVLFFGNKLFRRKLHYVVIGGWLPDFLKDKKLLSFVLKKFDRIYVETNKMKSALENQGFCNICVMPNCKKLNILDESELVYNKEEPLRLCTFSRVMKEKGIEDAAEAVKLVNEKRGRTVYSLDIFGQIDEEQINWFENLKRKFPDYVEYKGMVPFDKSTDVLKNYFALLFPTYYSGEGFAGTVIDAMAAGIPVVASDWKYNAEVVSENETGLLFETHNVAALSDILEKLSGNPDMIFKMKKSCLAEAKKYLPQSAVEILINEL